MRHYSRIGPTQQRGMLTIALSMSIAGARVAAAVQKGLEKKRRPATARGRDAGLIRSGLLKRPSTASAAKASHPSWIIPSAHMEAAARFDMRHQCLSARGERVMKYEGTPRGNTIERRFDVGGDALSRFELTLAEIRWNRFFVRENLDDGGRAFATVPKKKKEEDSFDPMKTIWAPRASYCDAKDLYDTEDCELRMFQVDWEKARKTGGFEKILIKADDDGWVDEDGDGVADEVEEVERALRDHHNLIYQTFDFYASLGDSNDIFHIDYNAYQSFYQKCAQALCPFSLTLGPSSNPYLRQVRHRHKRLQMLLLLALRPALPPRQRGRQRGWRQKGQVQQGQGAQSVRVFAASGAHSDHPLRADAPDSGRERRSARALQPGAGPEAGQCRAAGLGHLPQEVLLHPLDYGRAHQV